jgi:hypothetical protein
MTLSDEQRYFDALKTIAKLYMTTEQLARGSLKKFGLDYHEALEMSYDNIQLLANDAIKGKKRPK